MATRLSSLKTKKVSVLSTNLPFSEVHILTNWHPLDLSLAAERRQ